MDISKLDVDLNALDFYEMDHNGKATGIRHPDPVTRLRQQTSKQQGLSINEIGFDPSIRGLGPLEIRPSSPRQSYRDTGACLRCSSFDHWLAQCPKLAKPSLSSQLASASGKRVVIADDYDDYGSDASYGEA
jgi:hypothetical protein